MWRETHTDQTRIHRQHARQITHMKSSSQTDILGWPPLSSSENGSRLETLESQDFHCHSMQMNSIQETAASSPAGALAHWPYCHTSIKYRCVGPKDAQTVRLHPANGASTANVPTGTCSSWGSAQTDHQSHKEQHISESKIKNASLQRPHQSQV